MRLRDWIRENAAEIRAYVTKLVPNIGFLSLKDLEEWVNNDENLYRWAKSRRYH